MTHGIPVSTEDVQLARAARSDRPTHRELIELVACAEPKLPLAEQRPRQREYNMARPPTLRAAAPEPEPEDRQILRRTAENEDSSKEAPSSQH